MSYSASEESSGPPEAKRLKSEAESSVVRQCHSITPNLDSPLVGSSCVYCQRELKRPWELVAHMVDEHNVQIGAIECGRQLQKSMAPQSGCFCLLCEEIFSSTHLLYYHILQQHVKSVFGRESQSDFCVVEMITPEKRQLTLKVRIKVSFSLFFRFRAVQSIPFFCSEKRSSQSCC